MNLFFDVLAVVSFVVAFLPNLVNLLMISLWIFTGCNDKLTVGKWFFIWIALLVWPITYWILK